jgi:hypothetical protein
VENIFPLKYLNGESGLGVAALRRGTLAPGGLSLY